MRHVPIVAAVMLGLSLSASFVGQAKAQSSLFGWFDSPAPARQRPVSRPRSVAPVSATRAPLVSLISTLPPSAPGRPPVPLQAVVSLRDQHISIWSDGRLVLRSKVSTGTATHPTPTGVFSVIQKNRIHHSNIYSNAPMPFMQRITWSGIALHAGIVPNYPASHGCIRLPRDIAEQLYAITRIGMRVIIAQDDLVPVEIVSDLLPQPRVEPAAVGPKSPSAATSTSGLIQVNASDIGSSTARGMLASNETASAVGDAAFDAYELALRRKAAAAAAVRSLPAVARAALVHAAVKSAEANAAVAALRLATAELATAKAGLYTVVTEPSLTSEDGVMVRATAVAAVSAAEARYRAAAADEAVKTPEAFAAARTARMAETAAEDAPDQAKEAARGIEPVSVFVSAKERRLYARQGFEPMFDTAIAVSEPGLPLGTHVFTATSGDDANRSRLRWSVASIASGNASTALEALGRVEIPAAARAEIEKRLWAGASLIISDLGPSNETGRGTDFVLLTK